MYNAIELPTNSNCVPVISLQLVGEPVITVGKPVTSVGGSVKSLVGLGGSLTASVGGPTVGGSVARAPCMEECIKPRLNNYSQFIIPSWIAEV